MTSEVVIMNRRAAVLAADSAITVTALVDGRRERRYFKGANKVFELSHHEPVGVMFFNVADLHGVPWEVAIKMYRDHLGRNAFGSLDGYAEDFFSYLRENMLLFSDERRREIFQQEAMNAGLRLLRRLEARLESGPPDQDVRNAARNLAPSGGGIGGRDFQQTRCDRGSGPGTRETY